MHRSGPNHLVYPLLTIVVVGGTLRASALGAPAEDGRSSGAGSPLSDPSPQPVTQTLRSIEQGLDVRATVAISRSDLSVADRAVLSIEVDAPSSARVLLPDISEFPGFVIVSTEDSASLSADGSRTVTRRRTTLDPFLPGDKAIPEIAIEVRGTSGDTASHGGRAPRAPLVSLRSMPIPVRVRGIAPAGTDAQTPLRPPPILLPATADAGRSAALLGVATAVTVGAVGVGSVLAVRRLRARRTVAPSDVARSALQRLIERRSAAIDPCPPEEAIAEVGRVLRRWCADELLSTSPGATVQEIIPRLLTSDRLLERERAEGVAILTEIDRSIYAPTVAADQAGRIDALIARSVAWIDACAGAIRAAGPEGGRT